VHGPMHEDAESAGGMFQSPGLSDGISCVIPSRSLRCHDGLRGYFESKPSLYAKARPDRRGAMD